MPVQTILFGSAFLCFLFASVGILPPRFNILALGLALWILGIILASLHHA